MKNPLNLIWLVMFIGVVTLSVLNFNAFQTVNAAPQGLKTILEHPFIDDAKFVSYLGAGLLLFVVGALFVKRFRESEFIAYSLILLTISGALFHTSRSYFDKLNVAQVQKVAALATILKSDFKVSVTEDAVSIFTPSTVKETGKVLGSEYVLYNKTNTVYLTREEARKLETYLSKTNVVQYQALNSALKV